MRSWLVSATAGVAAAFAALASDAAVIVWHAFTAIGLIADAECRNASVEPAGGALIQPLCEGPLALRVLGVLTPAVAALAAASMTRRLTRADVRLQES